MYLRLSPILHFPSTNLLCREASAELNNSIARHFMRLKPQPNAGADSIGRNPLSLHPRGKSSTHSPARPDPSGLLGVCLDAPDSRSTKTSPSLLWVYGAIRLVSEMEMERNWVHVLRCQSEAQESPNEALRLSSPSHK